MNLDALRAYLLGKADAVEVTPFGPQTLVYKIHDQVFALVTACELPLQLTLRCDPERAWLLRGMYRVVRPGAYVNRRHWNTVTLDGSIPVEMILDMIEESYTLAMRAVARLRDVA